MGIAALLALAVTVLLFVGGLALASALGPQPATSTDTTTATGPTTGTDSTTSTDSTTTTGLTTPGQTTTTGATTTEPMAGTPDPNSPAARYSVINATVNAASDHEILGSSAFPNYATGAVDNYYAMAHSHLDNSPFAEGTASPADTGPIGQTAAAGNAQQPQYADARWPGDTGKATFGTQGQPYAEAEASDYSATATSSEASNELSGSSGPSASKTTALALPKGFDGRLRQALAKWRAKWLGRLHLKAPTAGTATKAIPHPTVTTPIGTVTTPTATFPGLATTPSVTVPTVTVPAVTVPTSVPTVSVPAVTVPSAPGPTAAPAPTTDPSRSLVSYSGGVTPSGSALPSGGAKPSGGAASSGGASSSPDGASLLESSTSAMLDPSSGALVTNGESSLKRVSIGGGQIVVKGIHVSATITNAGTVPACSAPADMTSTDTTTTGTGTTSTTTTTTDTTTTDTTATPDQGGSTAPDQGCAAPTDTTGTATTSTDTTGTTTPTDTSGAAPTDKASVTIASASIGGVPVTIDQDGVHVAGQGQNLPYQQASDALNGALKQAGIQLFLVAPQMTTSDNEKTVTATGLHVLFTQPAGAPGVPAQYAEHILGEVFVDSLAVPWVPLAPLDLSGGPTGPPPLSGGTTTSGGSSKGGAGSSKSSKSSSSPSSSSSFAQPASSSSFSQPASSSTFSQPAASSIGAVSQPATGSTGNALQTAPTALVSALRKPRWLLLAYLLFVAVVIATGWSLWSWRRGGAS